jgi:hypothetical protein
MKKYRLVVFADGEFEKQTSDLWGWYSRLQEGRAFQDGVAKVGSMLGNDITVNAYVLPDDLDSMCAFEKPSEVQKAVAATETSEQEAAEAMRESAARKNAWIDQYLLREATKDAAAETAPQADAAQGIPGDAS